MAALAGLGGLSSGELLEGCGASSAKGSLDDVKHVVILMQENRSFDHYYGTMAGVRGFGDRAALQLAGSRDVFHQPDPARPDGGSLLPFHIDTAKVDGQDLGDLLHDWNTTHQACHGGAYDQWVAAKGERTMGYFGESDIPFHRALAQAFTICDNYYCSVQGPTIPNRLYLWSGMIDPAGDAGGPATFNPADYQPVYRWTTYPERLQAAGVTWQVYANDEVGDPTQVVGSLPVAKVPSAYVGDYGDNPLWLFHAYHDALASTDAKTHELAVRASLRERWLPDSGQGRDVGHVIAQFAADCRKGTLPAVSWVVAPYGYCEHPAARPVDGEAYVAGVLSALWNNHDLWKSTVVFVDYDENDGFFDHVPPPTPPPGTASEYLPATQPLIAGRPPPSGPPAPIGLGPRVPMTVVSPWSRGGWVNSQVFDHTSVLRFLEVWTGVRETNISAWRRAVCGDLTGCFDFTTPATTIPLLPDTAGPRARADQVDTTLPPPAPPAPGTQTAPVQSSGAVRARALPYQPAVNATVGAALSLRMANTGTVAFPFSVYTGKRAGGQLQSPQGYDVAPGATVVASVGLDASTGVYDVWLHGPNGYRCHFAGNATTTALDLGVDLALSGPAKAPSLRLALANSGAARLTLAVISLDGTRQDIQLGPRASRSVAFAPLANAHGWYDLTLTLPDHPAFVWRWAGHLENGHPSLTG